MTGMSRRQLLGLLGGAAFCACSASARLTGAPPAPASGSRTSAAIQAVAFDLFTLFDPRGVERRVTEVLGDAPGLAASWKTRLFEYCWLRAAAGQYRDFQALADDSLSYALHAQQLTLTPAQRASLLAAFTELEPWSDSAHVLDSLRARGLRLAPLANFAPAMIERLLTRAQLADRFELQLSTDRARSYKPAPQAYALAEQALALPRQRIAFAAFGGWDAAGAHWFGFPTFWVNRLAQARDELGTASVASGPDLTALAQWLEAA